MSEKKTLLSRPRTRVYDCNYNIGEKYYKPMVEELDRKYSGRSSLPPFPSTFTSRARDDDFPRSHRGPSIDFEPIPERRSKLNGDTRSLEADLEEDIINSMNRLKVIRAAKTGEEFSSTLNGRSSLNGLREKKLNLSSKLLDSVGINDKMHDNLEEEILRKRTVKMPSLFDEDQPSFTKWSSLRDSPVTESAAELAAMARARQSRARLADIENEMDAVAERGAARDRRINNIKALIAGEDAYPDTVEAYRSKKLSSRAAINKKVSF